MDFALKVLDIRRMLILRIWLNPMADEHYDYPGWQNEDFTMRIVCILLDDGDMDSGPLD